MTNKIGRRFLALSVIALLVSLINVLPLHLFTIGGDTAFQYTLIECFSKSFWQGDLYPRWCMEANAGLGAPLFLFYFPLPYYLTAPLYPLQSLGISMPDIFFLGMLLATFITFYTTLSWLKDIVAPMHALAAAIIFIFLPYRMEAMLFRGGYAEVWAMAWIPLVFKYARRIAKGESEHSTGLAAGLALLFLSHIPDVIIITAATGLYMAGCAPREWRKIFLYLKAVAGASAMAAFYLVPAFIYKQYMGPVETMKERVWANGFLSMRNVTELGQERVALTIALMLTALTALSIYMLRQRKQLNQPFVAREIKTWVVICAIGAFLLFPISAPVYAWFGQLEPLIFPWRMQVLFMPAITFLIAAWMQWLAGEKRKKTAKADFALLWGLLVLLSYFVIGVIGEESVSLQEKSIQAKLAAQLEYRTAWAQPPYFSKEYVLSRYEKKQNLPQAEAVNGGDVAIERWGTRDIVLQTVSDADMTVRLNHLYFPLWTATADNILPLALTPESNTGFMLIQVPAGQHRVVLRTTVSAAAPWIAFFANALSLLSGAWWVVRLRHRM